jgi:DNA processing protein
MTEQEILYTMALTRINGFGLAGTLALYRTLGCASAIFEHRHELADIVPDCSPRLVEAMRNTDEPMKRAETELEYDLQHGILPLCMNDDDYPARLKECDDAPLILYYRGTANLNQQRVINIVGTRLCTEYGIDLIRNFITDLRDICPQVLVVSGLAYGVDINAHREALGCGFQTVGVLAHGLDYLYPTRHKATADEMVKNGGLLTEFMTNTNADKVNFVRRNRIVAGMSDACIVVESAAKGGSLITAELSQTYNRDVFAFPGAVGAIYSEGCNNLIRDNNAALISNAYDFAKAMRWEDEGLLNQKKAAGIERDLFPALDDDEQAIVNTLEKINDKQINQIAAETNLPINKVTSVLFNLEMKGVLKLLVGGTYHLLK